VQLSFRDGPLQGPPADGNLSEVVRNGSEFLYKISDETAVLFGHTLRITRRTKRFESSSCCINGIYRLTSSGGLALRRLITFAGQLMPMTPLSATNSRS
jgi:hypothetical protein